MGGEGWSLPPDAADDRALWETVGAFFHYSDPGDSVTFLGHKDQQVRIRLKSAEGDVIAQTWTEKAATEAVHAGLTDLGFREKDSSGFWETTSTPNHATEVVRLVREVAGLLAETSDEVGLIVEADF